MILASRSPRRIELLKQLGFELEIRPADIDETQRADERALDYVCRLAESKARAVIDALVDDKNYKGELYLAADTIVALDETHVLGKPKDESQAYEMLSTLSAHTHQVHTGVCMGYVGGRPHTFSCTTDVTFKELNPMLIKSYIASGEPMDKAGAYGIQGKARIFIESIHGDYENVVGLPVARVVDELAKVMNPADYTKFVSSYVSGERS